MNNAGIGTGRAAVDPSAGAEAYGKAMWEVSIDDDFQSGNHELPVVETSIHADSKC